jgi:hypothetical protein
MAIGEKIMAADGHWLMSEHTSLLSHGDDACGFRVLETDYPTAGYEDALDRRFISEQRSG